MKIAVKQERLHAVTKILQSKTGDNLGLIANKYDVCCQIKKWNGLRGNTILMGKV
jgi:LysM repeat protein